MISRRKMLGWLGALPLIAFIPNANAETETIKDTWPTAFAVIRDRTIRLPRNFNVNSCKFYRCRVITQDAFHMSACPIKGKYTVNYGSTAEWRPSIFHNSTFTDCIVGAE